MPQVFGLGVEFALERSLDRLSEEPTEERHDPTASDAGKKLVNHLRIFLPVKDFWACRYLRVGGEVLV
jgi:hypothetical protein